MIQTLSLLVLSQTAAVAVASDPPEVAVPFGCGLAFTVSQAHDVGSHRHNDTWAWDFRMPEGVPITAAAAGVVRMARGDSTVGGCDMKYARHANYVVIQHPGGIETQYLHFSAVRVKPGDRVRAGELLGYSGKTGWACGAHLHFKVARQEGTGWNNPSIPALLAGHGDPEANTVVAAGACDPLPDVQLAGAPAENDPPSDLRGGEVVLTTGGSEGAAAEEAPAPEQPPQPVAGELPSAGGAGPLP